MTADLSDGPPRWSHLWWLLPLTILYLVLELAFSARLLDTAGGLYSNDELNAVEFAGKTLSGCALALFLIGTPLLPIARRRAWPAATTAFAVLVTAAASVVTAHVVEQAIIDRFVERSSAEERQLAVWSSILRRAVLNDVVTLADLELTPDAAASPQGKATLALLPLMAAQVSDLEAKVARRMPEIVHHLLRRELGPQRFYDDAYRPSLIVLATAFAEVNGNADAASTEQFAAFLRRDDVQQLWREALSIEYPDFSIDYATTPGDAERAVYDPLLERRTRQELVKFTASPEAYARGGRFAELGRRAKESVIVPPVSLTFSLIGGVTMAARMVVYLLALAAVPRRVRGGVVGGLLALALALPFAASDPITVSSTFRALHEQAQAKLGALPALALLWVIRFEGAAYPVNEFIRREVLFGIDFGYRRGA